MPITITVEDGTGLAGANSYISVADADSYLANDPFYSAAWAALSSDAKAQYLIKARQLIDAYFTFRGKRTWVEQLLAWPRTGARDDDGVEIAEDEMRPILGQAQAALAVSIIGANPEAAALETRGFKKIKADTIELEIDSRDRAPTMPDAIAAMLKSLGSRAGSGQVKLVRT